MIVPVSGMDLLLQSEDPENIDVPGSVTYLEAGDDDMPVDDWMEIISGMSDMECLRQWHDQKEYIFGHREEPIPLFNTETVEKSGYEFEVVKKKLYGHKNRPVLERSKRFTKLGHQIGKIISLQYMIDSEESIDEAASQVPYDVNSRDKSTIKGFFDAHEAAWAYSATGPEIAGKFPISDRTTYTGMIYFMYILNETGQEIPLYIGMSRKLGRDDESLGSNFAGITRDSVFGRWGYGGSQHLGELSRAVFTQDYNTEPKKKYVNWADTLFADEGRILKCPVYIEMVPFFDQNIKDAEEKLIRLASRLFDSILLNKEYTTN
ncbi:hypothetical protein ACOJIV_27595 [Haloarcula sp. AONF1]